MEPIDQNFYEDELDDLLHGILPTDESISKRKNIFTTLGNLIKTTLPSTRLFGSGSTCLRTYLPTGDLDLVVISNSSDEDHQSQELETLSSIFVSLLQVEKGSSSGNSAGLMKSIEFVNARTKLMRCTSINGIDIDITVNHPGALATVVFLEEADRLIGYNHLFKRSVLLIKAWCTHEAQRYCGSCILGSKFGMLNSYALSILVLYLFNRYTNNLLHPFSVLRSFFYVYSGFRWDSFVMTLEGPVPIQVGNLKSDNLLLSKLPKTVNRFKSLSDKFSGKYCSTISSFSVRACNILDPIDLNNNLGVSVTRTNMKIIERALSNGHQHFYEILSPYFNVKQPLPSEDKPTRLKRDFLLRFFPCCVALYIGESFIPLKNQDVLYSCLEGDVTNLWIGHLYSSDTKRLQDSNKNKLETCDDTVTTKDNEEMSLCSDQIPLESSSTITTNHVVQMNTIEGKNETLLHAQSQMTIDKGVERNVKKVLYSLIFALKPVPHLAEQMSQTLARTHFTCLGSKNSLYEWLAYQGSLEAAIAVIDPSFLDAIQIDQSQLGGLASCQELLPQVEVIERCEPVSQSSSIATTPQRVQASSKSLQNKSPANIPAHVTSILHPQLSYSESQLLQKHGRDSLTSSKTTHVCFAGLALLIAFCFSYGNLLQIVFSTHVPISPTYPTISSLDDTSAFKGFVENVDEEELNAISSVFWIRRGSSLSIHGSQRGITVSPIQCMRMIIAFDRNVTFCNDAATASHKVRRSLDGKYVDQENKLLFRWYKDNALLLGQNKSILTILDSSHVNEGRYHCLRLNLEASSNALESVAVVDLKLSQKPSARKSKPSYTSLRPDTQMRLVVPQVAGQPEPEYQWLKNGFPVQGANNREYRIEAVSKTHEGTYSCKLSNVAGDYTWTEATIAVH